MRHCTTTSYLTSEKILIWMDYILSDWMEKTQLKEKSDITVKLQDFGFLGKAFKGMTKTLFQIYLTLWKNNYCQSIIQLRTVWNIYLSKSAKLTSKHYLRNMLIGLFCWIKFFKVRNAAERLINESIPTIFPSKEKPKPVLKDKQFLI